jgi:very-short-patch-repair endonuclease
MAIDEAALAGELLARHGVTTTTRLAALGIGRRGVDRLKQRGRLRSAGQGVLASTSWPETLEHRMAIACAATRGVVRFPTAGLVWELRKTPRTAEVHVVIADGRRIDPLPDVVVHRSCSIEECDIVRRGDGIAVTSPPRTAFDAAWMLARDDLESLIEQGIQRRMFAIPTLWALARRMREHGRPGSARFGQVLGARAAWRRPVDSDYELRLERAMRRRGFPPLTRQCRLELPNGRIVHADLGLPEHGFFVEVDHLTWHGGRMAADYDSRRDLQVSALGLRVERVTDVSIDRHLAETVDALWAIWQHVLRSHVHRFGAPRSPERPTAGG